MVTHIVGTHEIPDKAHGTALTYGLKYYFRSESGEECLKKKEKREQIRKACGKDSIKGLMTGSCGKRKIFMEMRLLSCYNVFEQNLRQKIV